MRVSVRTRGGELTEDPDTAVQLCGAVKGLGITYDPSYFVSGPFAAVERDRLFSRTSTTSTCGTPPRTACR